MKRDDFRLVQTEDLTRLGLENQFLSLEVSVLRAKLTASDAVIAKKDTVIAKREAANARLQAQLETASQRALVPEGQALVGGSELEALRKARRDLQWTLNRLEGTIVGPLIRRRPGFKRLVETYLRD